MLSFNFSVAGNKQWMCSYEHPLQIMPQTTHYLNESHIATYPECTNQSDSVIHTSYITRPWSGLLDETRFNKFKFLMSSYVKLCRRLSYKRLLVHLPSTQSEMDNLSDGMRLLIKMFNKVDDIVLVLEVPAFKGGFKCDLTEYLFNIITNYFDKFVNKNVELCIDTAHMFANGVDCKQMVDMFETTRDGHKLLDYCTIIHLNGNMNSPGKPDIHCPMFDNRNKMTDVDTLMQYLSDKNKILIAECSKQHASYDEWVSFANKYNINIVPYHEQMQT